jgi:hypothetical protein
MNLKNPQTIDEEIKKLQEEKKEAEKKQRENAAREAAFTAAQAKARKQGEREILARCRARAGSVDGQVTQILCPVCSATITQLSDVNSESIALDLPEEKGPFFVADVGSVTACIGPVGFFLRRQKDGRYICPNNPTEHVFTLF